MDERRLLPRLLGATVGVLASVSLALGLSFGLFTEGAVGMDLLLAVLGASLTVVALATALQISRRGADTTSLRSTGSRKRHALVLAVLNDAERGAVLARTLEQLGIRAWLSFEDASIGDHLDETFDAALSESDVVFVIVPGEEASRSNLFYEMGYAAGMGLPIIAVLVDPSAGVPPTASVAIPWRNPADVSGLRASLAEITAEL